MKKYKEIIIETNKKTDEYKKLEKQLEQKKITKEQMEKQLQKNYRAKGEKYEKYT
jgi:hypothetical protein